ncbi:gamma-glutamyltransferase [Actinoplanes cyaneus]|uniref:Gamma-glutamyltransferase n=1 Tax=Actinoplanes cyaneus TaxID=52696 RepID=A0A919MB22_9ACTN|nr:gamma-glutamyltransferase [Actinoplanes cyaneus]GID64656.1 gamma-glutamyltransferase [Actinoplanes cyaneus]
MPPLTVAFAAPHPAAADAARAVVAAGGNALDAALAGAAALTVAYPHQCSIGGDLVAIVRPAGAAPRAVLSIGAAAAAVDVAALRAAGPLADPTDSGEQLGPRMPFEGPQTVTVPGVVAGWAAIAGLGARLPLAELLAPARALAADGVPVSAGLRRAVLGRLDGVRADPGLSALLLDRAGEPVGTLVQPALAASLDLLAGDWRSFYSGRLAQRLVAGLARLGIPLSAGDLAAHRAEITDPLTRVIDGVTWHAAPPPVQGATFLAVAGSPALLADARRAQLARNVLLGDPRTGPVDLDGLLLRNPVTGAERTGPVAPDGQVRRDPVAGAEVESTGPQPGRAESTGPRPPRAESTGPRPPRAESTGPRPGGDTVAVTAVDSGGTAVTLIQSVFGSFGSGLLEPGTGIVLHNRGSSFSLDPSHPGRLAPGVRPPHTLCPALAVGADTVVALGCQGGRSQPWILAQVAADALVSPRLDEVLARPRWVIGAEEIDRRVATLLLEPGTPGAAGLASTAAGLGLAVETTGGRHDDAGHVQVARLSGGVLAAASDPRADGQAIVT